MNITVIINGENNKLITLSYDNIELSEVVEKLLVLYRDKKAVAAFKNWVYWQKVEVKKV